MPKVLATADLHGNLPAIPDCDLLVIAGDICPDFFTHRPSRTMEKGEQRQKSWLNTEFREWLDELSARNIEVVGIAGNHDYVFEHHFLIPDDLPWTYLRDEGHTSRTGLKLWGTPWVPNLPNWAFYGSERALEIRCSIIPEDLDILISHGPPYGLGDMIGPFFGGPKPVGDIPLLKKLDRIRPTVVVCGHIHEAHGVYDYPFDPDSKPYTTVYNVAYVDETYAPVNPIVELTEFTYV